MQLSVIGLNHQTAPLSIREKIAFSKELLPLAIQDFLANNIAKEVVILSTCNRTELYCIDANEDCINWLANFHQLNASEISPYFYTLNSNDSIHHAFMVACGLDSMVLGEPQILGQMKEAVRISDENNGIDTYLNALFQKTFSVAKEVRTDTDIGKNSVSMATASIKLTQQIFPSISDLNILFIGAGEMIELVALYFAAKNPRYITVVNRTLPRARELCDKLGVNAESKLLSDLPNIIGDYDVIISSTASQLPLIGKGMVERALKYRSYKPIFMLDLAVPRDIEKEVSELNDVYHYTLDDMINIVNIGKDARKKASNEALKIIKNRVFELVEWYESRQSIPLIVALRDEGEKARRQVLENAMKLLTKGSNPEEVLERLSIQLTNKLLHSPTRILNKATSKDSELVNAVAKIYHLEKDDRSNIIDK